MYVKEVLSSEKGRKGCDDGDGEYVEDVEMDKEMWVVLKVLDCGVRIWFIFGFGSSGVVDLDCYCLMIKWGFVKFLIG